MVGTQNYSLNRRSTNVFETFPFLTLALSFLIVSQTILKVYSRRRFVEVTLQFFFNVPKYLALTSRWATSIKGPLLVWSLMQMFLFHIHRIFCIAIVRQKYAKLFDSFVMKKSTVKLKIRVLIVCHELVWYVK